MSEDKWGIREIDFEEKVRKDKVFLLSLLDDPVKACLAYGILADDKLLGMMQTIAHDALERAGIAFAELGGWAKISDGCRACKGCQACELCGAKGIMGEGEL